MQRLFEQVQQSLVHPPQDYGFREILPRVWRWNDDESALQPVRTFVLTLGTGETKELIAASIEAMGIDSWRDHILVVEHSYSAFQDLGNFMLDCRALATSVAREINHTRVTEIYLVGLSRGALAVLAMAGALAMALNLPEQASIVVVAMSPAIARPTTLMPEMFDLANMHTIAVDWFLQIQRAQSPTSACALETSLMCLQIFGAARLLRALGVDGASALAATASNIVDRRAELAVYQTAEFRHLTNCGDPELRMGIDNAFLEIHHASIKHVHVFFSTPENDLAIDVNCCRQVIETARIRNGIEQKVTIHPAIERTVHAMTRAHQHGEMNYMSPREVWAHIFSAIGLPHGSLPSLQQRRDNRSRASAPSNDGELGEARRREIDARQRQIEHLAMTQSWRERVQNVVDLNLVRSPSIDTLRLLKAPLFLPTLVYCQTRKVAEDTRHAPTS